MTETEHSSNVRGCPCCGSTAQPAWTLSSAQRAEEMTFDELKSSWAGFFKEKAFFTYGQCPSCGLVYCSRYFTDGQLQQLYASMEDNTSGLDVNYLARAQTGYYDIIKESLNCPGDFLELGPDIGLFSKNIIEHENFDTHWLIEPNRETHQALAKVCGGKKHRILTDAAEIDQIPDGSLALVVMIHVLDHLLDPLALLQQLHRKMRTGGVLAVVVHDQSSLPAVLLKKRWPAYCLQHPQLYSPGTACKLLAQGGLTKPRVEKTYNYFPFNYLAQHLIYALGLGRRKLGFLPSNFIRVKLGNMAVVATKE